ncbi:hypothetical protein RJ639_020787 [Escallonia herrerae]|uniref:Arginyl-tRNA--protein transferase n=1 Tax=Escallonia herrerae TaxID=1293975 RepID=A0AA89AGJ1_9ASTE|nr:hypothetical protein RJ639_020787 [Escallonia herrerae]
MIHYLFSFIALLDRGWRRSGCFLYKPEMDRTCCPSYTIRLKASDFVPSKEQQRVSKRMQRFLDGILSVRKSDGSIDAPNSSNFSYILAPNETTSIAAKEFLAGNLEGSNKAEQYTHYLSEEIGNAVRACIECGEFPSDVQLPKPSVKQVVQGKRKLLVEGSEDLLYSSNISFQIAAALRRANNDVQCLKSSEHSKQELSKSTESTPKFIAEKLASYLNHLSETCGLLVRACNGHINLYSTTKEAYSDVLKESPTGSGGKKSCLKKCSGRPQGKRQRFEIRLNRSSFDPEEYALYRRYQIKVHNDTPDHVSESSYKRFLVDTPLIYVPYTGDSTVPPCGFGSFHQQYIINGRLVAVGVIDILPKCLSSKYLFWDPDLAFLSLGKYSALQEIGWVRETEVHCPSLQYYYLGYYIDSCRKMRYKAAYRPSELLCPLRYQWVPFNIAKPLLDTKPYVVLSDFDSLQNEESAAANSFEDHMELQHDDSFQEQDELNDISVDEDEEMSELDSEDSDDGSDPETSSPTAAAIDDGGVSNIAIGLKEARLRYKDLQQAFGPTERRYLETQLHRYVRAVGPELSQRMVYSLG